MEKETRKEVGHGLDGSYRFTIGALVGLLLVVIGVGLVAYFGFSSVYLIFAIPLILLGLATPIILQLLLGGKRRG